MWTNIFLIGFIVFAVALKHQTVEGGIFAMLGMACFILNDILKELKK